MKKRKVSDYYYYQSPGNLNIVPTSATGNYRYGTQATPCKHKQRTKNPNANYIPKFKFKT